MLIFFIGISFFVHAITLAAIYLMYQHVQRTKSTQTKEIDQLMQSYLGKIQKENDKLQDSLHKSTPLNHSEKKEHTSISNEARHKVYKQNQHWNPESLIQTNDKDLMETSLESRVLQLHRTGVPVDDIAKQLHCGKTEASLIIQFQKDI